MYMSLEIASSIDAYASDWHSISPDFARTVIDWTSLHNSD